jgi:hypothetical protein
MFYEESRKEGCKMAKSRKRKERFTPEQLEQMTTHELADLLANTAIVLRRLPDIPVVDLESEDRSGVWARYSRTRGEKRNSQSKKVDDNEGENKNLPDWIE